MNIRPFLVAVAVAFVSCGPAAAHVPHRVSSSMSLAAQERALARNLAHSQGAVRWIQNRRRAPVPCDTSRRAQRDVSHVDRAFCWHRAARAWQASRLEQLRDRLELTLGSIAAIRLVWPEHLEAAAIGVAVCESDYYPRDGVPDVVAENGQYENIFQMGLSERRRFGWHTKGSPAVLAARAAYAYYRLSGWSPWQCLPDGGRRW